jgi:LPS sulfotransferase NodH
VACWFIYWKIQSQRKETKKERDEAHDNLVTRVTLLEHDVEFMKQQNSIFGQKLDRILDELTSIKVELAKKEDK